MCFCFFCCPCQLSHSWNSILSSSCWQSSFLLVSLFRGLIGIHSNLFAVRTLVHFLFFLIVFCFLFLFLFFFLFLFLRISLRVPPWSMILANLSYHIDQGRIAYTTYRQHYIRGVSFDLEIQAFTWLFVIPATIDMFIVHSTSSVTQRLLKSCTGPCPFRCSVIGNSLVRMISICFQTQPSRGEKTQTN